MRGPVVPLLGGSFIAGPALADEAVVLRCAVPPPVRPGATVQLTCRVEAAPPARLALSAETLNPFVPAVAHLPGQTLNPFDPPRAFRDTFAEGRYARSRYAGELVDPFEVVDRLADPDAAARPR